jgi:hypothetical protein
MSSKVFVKALLSFLKKLMELLFIITISFVLNPKAILMHENLIPLFTLIKRPKRTKRPLSP